MAEPTEASPLSGAAPKAPPTEARWPSVLIALGIMLAVLGGVLFVATPSDSMRMYGTRASFSAWHANLLLPSQRNSAASLGSMAVAPSTPTTSTTTANTQHPTSDVIVPVHTLEVSQPPVPPTTPPPSPPHPPSAPHRAGGTYLCTDVWDHMVEDEERGTTCGDKVRDGMAFGTAGDPFRAIDQTARDFSACAACGFVLTAQGIAELVLPKVQCLADCLPGGKTHGLPFCKVHGADAMARYQQQHAIKHQQRQQRMPPAELLVTPGYKSLEAPWPDESCLAPGDNASSFFEMAIARGPAPRPTQPWYEKQSLDDIKLVINAAGNRDSLPLKLLLQSIANANFGPWSRVIVVFGGADTETEEPRLVPLSQVADHLNLTMHAEQDPSIVVIRTKLMNYDLHGLAMLGRHHSHPLVRARGYLYLLETAMVEPNFVEAIGRLDSLLTTPTTILTVPPPNANIALMAGGVPARFGHNFELLLTKQQGLQPEHGLRAMTREGCDANEDAKSVAKTNDADGWGHEPCREHSTNRVFYPLLAYGEVTFVGRRTMQCTNCTVWDDAAKVDVYGTGTPRVSFLYKQFGVRKFVLWGGSGDLNQKKLLGSKNATASTQNASKSSQVRRP